MSRRLAALVLGLAVLGLAAPARAVTLRCDTPVVELRVKPGEKSSGTVGIQNPTEDAAVVRIYAEDWAYAEGGTGEKVFYVADTLPDSAAKWIRVNVQDMPLPPFSKREVNYTVQVPPEAAGTYRSVLFFETAVGEAADTEGARVLVTARLGSIFKIEIDGTVKRSGAVTALALEPPRGSKPASFQVTFKNDGNTDIEMKGNFMILDAAGAAKGRGELEAIFTQAGTEATRTTTWAGKLAPGVYEVIFTFDLGEGEILSEERKMTVA
jgi:hypothetical protein